jgi:light-regulated signal transduction histidine kinase (bacteriophytochrome)
VLDGAVEAERADSLDALDQSFTYVVATMFAQVAGVVVLGAVVMVALNRLIVRPLAHLGADARLVAEGHLDRRVAALGSPELVRMGEDVDAMRVRIVDELAQLKRIREQLEAQTAELVRSNEDLEQFAYVASHDLQEPLRKVSGFCQLLEKRYAEQLDDRAREYISYATDGARRMQDLINDLLAFSRVGRTSEGFVPVDLGEVAAEVVSVFESRVEDDDVTITVADGMPVVSGDRRLLGQVLQNLVGNGIKFRREEPPVVEVSATDEGDHWVISVADNGIGIDDAYADQIFTIFKRLHTKTEYEGTGIGLALSKKIVEYHGGRIWLDPSGDTPGTTFRFSLPHAPADEPGPAATEESPA